MSSGPSPDRRRAWTAPHAGTFHFNPAPDTPPHPFEGCGDRCRAAARAGWLEWVAKGVTVDLDDDRSHYQP